MATRALTQEEQAEYLENPGHCPFCKSQNITGGPIQVDGKTCWQEVTCSDCEQDWHDVYQLLSVDDLFNPKQDLNYGTGTNPGA